MGDPRDLLELEGRTIDNVRFDAFIDEGGFGYVYRAWHLGLGVPVAVKCLKISGDTKYGSFAARFRDETKIAYKLSQGCLDIVRSISSGTLTAAQGVEVPYMVLEWLEGSTLEAAMYARKEQKKPPMELAEVIALLESAALALAHAHAEGVVHRDVKPSNLFLTQTRDGMRLKVLDFGLAKIVDTESFMTPESGPTATNIFVCSPAYGAPEQFAREMGEIGAWTDVYSFAFVLMEMLTGERVREAESLVEGMVKALDPNYSAPVPSNLKAEESVRLVFTKATALATADRYKDVTEFWKDLRAAMNGAAGPQIVTADMPKDARAEAIRRVESMSNIPVSRKGGTLMLKDVSGERARAIAAAKAAAFQQSTLPLGMKSTPFTPPGQSGGSIVSGIASTVIAPSVRPSNVANAISASSNPPQNPAQNQLQQQQSHAPQQNAPGTMMMQQPAALRPSRPPTPTYEPHPTPVPMQKTPTVVWVALVLVLGLIAAVVAYAIVRARH